MTLTEFLLARIAEDEAVAREARNAVEPSRWSPEQDWTGSSDEWTLTTVQSRTIFHCCEEGHDLDQQMRESNEHLSGVGLEPLPLSGIDSLHNDGRGIGVASRPEVEHIARHDPARVLAECEAKRALLEFMPSKPTPRATEPRNLRVMAAVYADHPDYRDEWKP